MSPGKRLRIRRGGGWVVWGGDACVALAGGKLHIVSNRSISYNFIDRDPWQQPVLRAEEQAKPHIFPKHHRLTRGKWGCLVMPLM